MTHRKEKLETVNNLKGVKGSQKTVRKKIVSTIRKEWRDFCWWSSCPGSELPAKGAQVPSLLKEPRSQKPCSTAGKRKTKKEERKGKKEGERKKERT